jgi:8-amino-7-oxononanoate synthase
VLDFTSALYLGFRHPSASLRPWSQLTLGGPAALSAPPHEPETARRLAALMGTEAAVLAPSTLHVFWDLVPLLAEGTVYVEDGTYPVARWGAERAVGRGARVQTFAHHNPADLARRLRREAAQPLVVADGVCPECGHRAPVGAYLELAASRGGALVIDDSQGLGLLGPCGGGTLRSAGAGGPEVVVVASLAKAFGAPVAVIAGTRRIVRRFCESSETRVHTSPPSVAVITAAAAALDLNERDGDALRARLRALVRRFRAGVRDLGLVSVGGLFPVQTVIGTLDPYAVHGRLRGEGVQALLRRRHGRACISFALTARHRPEEIDRAVAALARAAATRRAEVVR